MGSNLIYVGPYQLDQDVQHFNIKPQAANKQDEGGLHCRYESNIEDTWKFLFVLTCIQYQFSSSTFCIDILQPSFKFQTSPTRISSILHSSFTSISLVFYLSFNCQLSFNHISIVFSKTKQSFISFSLVFQLSIVF